MSEEDLWFWLLTLGVAVVGGGAAALRSLKIARLIEDTPTSRIRSAAQGYVELVGRGRPLAGTENLAPLTQRPCIWWRYRISRKTKRGGSKRSRDAWQTVASGTSALPFQLDDGTGQCIVKPDGAEVVATESTTWYGNTPWPTAGPGQALSRFEERDYRYIEERIYEHELVYALGGFRSTSAAPDETIARPPPRPSCRNGSWTSRPCCSASTATPTAGSAWRNGNRRGSPHATRSTSVAAAGRIARSKSCTCWPGRTSDQLFLLAALPAGDVARRYRRRAMLAFAGFVTAVFALGWLLQDAFG